jgi:hypothetical protein
VALNALAFAAGAARVVADSAHGAARNSPSRCHGVDWRVARSTPKTPRTAARANGGTPGVPCLFAPLGHWLCTHGPMIGARSGPGSRLRADEPADLAAVGRAARLALAHAEAGAQA